MDITRHHVGMRMSQISIFNGTIYLAGQIPKQSLGLDMRAQTSEVLGAIDALLAEAGSDKSRILSCQIFLRDMADFAQMNEVWDAWVLPGNTPPRATVQAAMATATCNIEIIVIAAVRAA